ncbi:hypothetical protein [Breoghania sp.]|uniref:hypothetical protein n=1 Tax=Breoghania sp. TaxID=2065378 RepID=UPI0029CA39E1|nr:hypothetical protein [Breoghania sp.]
MEKPEIIEHGDGWVYVLDGKTSKPFPTREAAETAGTEASRSKTVAEEVLEEGLVDSFPASDPVSVTRVD